MGLEYAVDLGELCAASLMPRVVDGDGGPELLIGDDEAQIRVGVEFGSRAQSILGVQRLLSAAQEYLRVIGGQ